MPLTPAERTELFRRCDRFVTGHGIVRARAALVAAAEEVGDDELRDFAGAGPMIEALEAEVATLLGKPAAVILPSGTMAQQIALRIWADRSGCRTVAFHPTCHLELHEQRGYAFVHDLRARLVGERHRLFTRADLDAIAEPVAALLVELPQREIGGQLPSWDELAAVVGWARDRGVALHLDGARVWETRPFYDRDYAAITAGFDSVYVSFYKVLGALSGAALAGPADFVAHARVWARRLGGTLVTQLATVATARAGLRTRLPKIPAYVARAASLARTLGAIDRIQVIPSAPPTNMMHVALPGTPDDLLDATAEVARDHRICLFTRLRPSELPGYSLGEISIGESALTLTDAELAPLFRRLLAR